MCAGEADYGTTPTEICANNCVQELIDCVDDPALSSQQQADVLPVAGICSALHGDTPTSSECDINNLRSGSGAGFSWQRVCCKDGAGCADQLPDVCGPLCADAYISW